MTQVTHEDLCILLRDYLTACTILARSHDPSDGSTTDVALVDANTRADGIENQLRGLIASDPDDNLGIMSNVTEIISNGTDIRNRPPYSQLSIAVTASFFDMAGRVLSKVRPLPR